MLPVYVVRVVARLGHFTVSTTTTTTTTLLVASIVSENDSRLNLYFDSSEQSRPQRIHSDSGVPWVVGLVRSNSAIPRVAIARTLWLYSLLWRDEIYGYIRNRNRNRMSHNLIVGLRQCHESPNLIK